MYVNIKCPKWLLIVAAYAICTSSTILKNRNDTELFEQSESIVIGTVSGIRQEADIDENPITVFTISPIFIEKGRAFEKYDVYVDIGYTNNGLLRYTIGEPSFKQGEIVLVFLEKGKIYNRVIGQAVGKYELVKWNGEIYCEKDFSSFSEKKSIRNKLGSDMYKREKYYSTMKRLNEVLPVLGEEKIGKLAKTMPNDMVDEKKERVRAFQK